MKKIIVLSFCLLLFGNSARAMLHEEDTSAQKAVIVSPKAAEEPKKMPKTQRELNDDLVERGREAISRQITGLLYGYGGYEKNPKAARELNDMLVERGDLRAIIAKIEGLLDGRNGYEKNPQAAKEFNDGLVERGDLGAITRKIYGFSVGRNGYEQNLEAARKLNDDLVERDDQQAITRKIEALTRGGDSYPERVNSMIMNAPPGILIFTNYFPTYGYEKNLEVAKEFNDTLVERGDQQAITRKIEALTRGGDSYQERVNSRVINAPRGISISYTTHYFPTYGYEKNLEAAKEFEEFIKILPFLSKVLNKYTPLPKNLQTIILRYIHRSIK